MERADLQKDAADVDREAGGGSFPDNGDYLVKVDERRRDGYPEEVSVYVYGSFTTMAHPWTHSRAC